MIQKNLFALVGLLALVIVATSTLYYVDEREMAIVFKFGEIIRADDKPGLHFKLPFVNNVQYYDARIQTMDAEPELFLTNEKKNLVVDSFVKWRIKDVAKYYVTVGGQTALARSRLAQVVNNGLRDEFGKRSVNEVITGERVLIMDILTKNTNKEAAEYGIEVVDVRLKRVDLDAEISQSVYNRMEAERARVAKERRAQGAEEAEKISADADRQKEVILAEAYRKAEKIRGQGDAKATATYAEAFGRDREFYSLYRSLNAYRDTFRDKQDFLILDPDSDFFKYFKNPNKK